MSSAMTVKWNIDELKTHITNITKGKEDLESNRDFLRNVDATVNDAWKGIAGSAFGALMEFDLESYNDTIKNLEDLIHDLNKVVNDCYTPCEDEVKTLVTTLARKVV
ncbi:MAG: WXG100 family type VII secretion target [Ruminiclostridium sp.]|nr:WXG100 family type VII secretion target [Ruminiclostridium sp.]